jgi:predicted NAD/FAD-dependent oxidoreductase
MRLPAPLVMAAHRWRFARSGRLGLPSLWSGRLKLGLCGDWLLGPRVECAWMSGHHLADRIGPA